MVHPANQTAEKKATILLVDDEIRDLETVASLLEDAGFTVLKAANGPQAIGVAARHTDEIDLLVTDIALPGVNGIELHRTLCETHKSLCNVLFISARSGSEVLRFYGLKISDPHFLGKPFSARQLLNRLKRLMDGKEPLRIKAS